MNDAASHPGRAAPLARAYCRGVKQRWFQSDTAIVGSGRGLPHETYCLYQLRPNEDKMVQDETIPILKPCPFCGDRAQIVHTGTFSVQCADCGATGPPAPTLERAAVRWNKRKGDDFGW
jgi:Lar family restriction alleviation protein